MKPLIKASLISGLSIFASCLLLILLDGALIALMVITIIPGPVYGILILLYNGNLPSWKVALFLLLTMVLYYVIIYFLDIHNYDDGLFPYKVLVSSMFGSVILRVLCDRFYGEKPSMGKSLFRPAWIGAKAAIPSVLSAVLLQMIEISKTSFLFVAGLGLLSIIPLWQYMFSKSLLQDRDCAKYKLAKSRQVTANA